MIAFPLALLARRFPRLESSILGVSTGLYTIPSLALFPLLVPFTGLSADDGRHRPRPLRAHDPGARPSSRACESVPDDVRESATGLGYGRRRLLLRIELPLALPVIMAGLRVATVSTVALTTVGTLVSYGGLGNLIKDGVDTNFRAELFAAAVLCVAARRPARRPARAGAAAAHPLDAGAGRMNIFADTWAYLTDPANWQGDGGMLGAAAGAAAADRHRPRARDA